MVDFDDFFFFIDRSFELVGTISIDTPRNVKFNYRTRGRDIINHTHVLAVITVYQQGFSKTVIITVI